MSKALREVKCCMEGLCPFKAPLGACEIDLSPAHRPEDVCSNAVRRDRARRRVLEFEMAGEDEADALAAERAIAEAEKEGTMSLDEIKEKYTEPPCSTTNTPQECENCKALKDRIEKFVAAIAVFRGMLGDTELFGGKPC